MTGTNLVLIGMPGAGKSTIGVLLAKYTARGFVDTDLLIQTDQGCSLQDTVDRHGYLALRAIEERILLALDVGHCVIATGGSAVYSPTAMRHLAAGGPVVFLHVGLPELLRRVGDFGTRGLAKRPDQSFADLFAERLPLYRRYAQVTIPCDGLDHEHACRRVLDAVAPTITPEASPCR